MPTTHDPLSHYEPAARVGQYRLLQVLGEGGMGIVYEAEELEPVRRRVALKILKDRYASSEVVARFEVERQALAVMNHPGIAKVFGAGSTPEGRPYFVMELVRGQPITTFCDEHRLALRERLGLFIAVCQAVQHAHQKGLIHRDLKPSNILVTESDGRPEPKVIDFGIAKATGLQLTERTLVTQAGQALGTAAYMSPEQADSSATDIDTRTDVYSLGVVLYELLVGRLPVDPAEVGFPLFIAQLLSRDTPTPLPSTQLDHPHDSLSVAMARRTDVTHLRRQLRGDLDWITLRAMEADRTRRYATANALAMDLQRYLDDEPVVARPPSTAYRVGKFIRRHRGVTAAAALAAIAVLAGTTFTTIGMVRARRAERLAAAEAEAARQVTDFLVNIFRISNPGEVRGNAVTARELLDRGAERVHTELATQPLLRSRMQHTMGVVYSSLGLYAPAQRLFESALQGRETSLGPMDTTLAPTLLAMGVASMNRGDYDDAQRHLSRALLIRETAQGAGHADVSVAVAALAQLRFRQGRHDEAERLYGRALQIDAATRSDSDRVHARHLLGLGVVYWGQGRFAESEPLLRRALAIQERALGPDHLVVAATIDNLGTLYWKLGRHAEALPFYERARRILEGALPPTHPDLAMNLNNVAETYWKLGRHAEAEPLFRRALAVKEGALRPTHPSIAVTLSGLGGLLSDMGRHAEAEPLLRRALAIRVAAFGEENQDTRDSRRQLAALLQATGRGDEGARIGASAPR